MQYSQEHLKTMVYAEFGGQTECIMGNWKIENWKSRWEMLIDGDDISNDVITRGACFQVFFQCLFTFALVSASRWLTKIWQLSRRGATVELEAEFKFQGRSCKLCFHFPSRRQIARRLALRALAVSRLSSSYFEYYLPIALPYSVPMHHGT